MKLQYEAVGFWSYSVIVSSFMLHPVKFHRSIFHLCGISVGRRASDGISMCLFTWEHTITDKLASVTTIFHTEFEGFCYSNVRATDAPAAPHFLAIR